MCDKNNYTIEIYKDGKPEITFESNDIQILETAISVYVAMNDESMPLFSEKQDKEEKIYYEINGDKIYPHCKYDSLPLVGSDMCIACASCVEHNSEKYYIVCSGGTNK